MLLFWIEGVIVVAFKWEYEVGSHAFAWLRYTRLRCSSSIETPRISKESHWQLFSQVSSFNSSKLYIKMMSSHSVCELSFICCRLELVDSLRDKQKIFHPNGLESEYAQLLFAYAKSSSLLRETVFHFLERLNGDET